MTLDNSFELFCRLKKLNLLAYSPKYWWPKTFSFEVVIGAVLTQNTRWENVEKSLQNLHSRSFLQNQDQQDLEKMAQIDLMALEECIVSSGFYRQKAARIQSLSQNILETFSCFENFQRNVTRQWLLEQRGIGFESADSILNYACKRDVMVIDRYTQKMLYSLGWEFEDYLSLQEWCERGIRENLDQLEEYENLCHIFARFHGKIVEFSKRKLEIKCLF